MKSTTLLAALFLLLASPGFSADPKPGEAPKAPAKKEKPASAPDEKAMHLPFKGTVVEVTPRTLTLNAAEGKDPRKFKTNKDTEILKGDKAATHDDIKVGMEVTGSFVREGDTGHDHEAATEAGKGLRVESSSSNLPVGSILLDQGRAASCRPRKSHQQRQRKRPPLLEASAFECLGNDGRKSFTTACPSGS